MSESDHIVITVEKREETGKAQVRRLRRQGKIPAIVYGGDKESFPVTVDQHTVQELLRKQGGENTIFLLKLAGGKQERRAMIKDLQIHPITNEIKHIDFIRVTRGHKLNVNVPIVLEGDSAGVRHGGMVNFVSRELQVEILPRDMIDRLVVDISKLDIGDSVRVEDIESMLPPSAKFLEDSKRMVVTIDIPRAAMLEEKEEEEEETVLGEQAEPEVIGGRAGDEDEES